LVMVMADPKHGAAQLRFILIRSARDVTLDAFSDRGFDCALKWFVDNGWDMESASREAARTPLLRVTVSRSEKR